MKKVGFILILAFCINLTPISITKATAQEEYIIPAIVAGIQFIKSFLCPSKRMVCKPVATGEIRCQEGSCFSFRKNCVTDADCPGSGEINPPEFEALGIDLGDFLLPGFWIAWDENGYPYLTDGSVGMPYPY